jgi:hypothetical protein
MGEITPDIHKEKLPRTQRWPIHYQAIETPFRETTDERLYLNVYFWHGYRDPFRDWPTGGGAHRLVDIDFDRERTRREHRIIRQYEAWADDEDPLVVRVSVEPIRQEAANTARFRCDLLAGLLQREVAALARGGLFRRRWRLWLGLCADPYRLEAYRNTWTGIREDEPVCTVVPLEDEA